MRLRRLTKWFHLVLAGVLMLAVWVLLVWVGNRPALRRLIDMTPQQRATIDPVTIDLLQELAEQRVTVEFHTFYEASGQVPQDPFQQQRQRILDQLRGMTQMLLHQYEFNGGDLLRVIDHDPYGDIQATREARQRFQTADSDIVVVAVQQPGRPPRHRTLSIEGDMALIETPVLRMSQGPVPAPSLPVLKDYKGEQALSSALKGLLLLGTPKVYFLNCNPYDADLRGPTGSGYSALLASLNTMGFDIGELDVARSGGVPRDAAMVAVIEPRREFSTTETKALQDYVLRGGRVFVNYSFSSVLDKNPTGGEFGRLFGYEVGPLPVYHLIYDRRDPSGRGRGIDGDPRVGKLDLLVDGNHPITRRIHNSNQPVQVDAARELLLADGGPPGIRRHPLLVTGPEAWIAVIGQDGYPDTHAPRLPSAFTNRLVGAVLDVDGEPDQDGKRPTGSVVLVTGVFCNNLGMNVNRNLAANVFNHLSERRVLLDLGGSDYESRRLEVSLPQLDRIWWLLIVAVPGLLLVLGSIVFWRRRDR